MPDAAGQFKGISVPELPWLQWFDPGDCVRVAATGAHGQVMEQTDEDGVFVQLDNGNVADFAPGELRRI